MATRIELPPLPPFDPIGDPSSISQRWKSWKKRFETYIIAMNITEAAQKEALFLYQAGQETQEVFETIPDPDSAPEGSTVYDIAMIKLTTYFTPKKNVDYEVFQFRQAAQLKSETIDQFATRLRKL